MHDALSIKDRGRVQSVECIYPVLPAPITECPKRPIPYSVAHPNTREIIAARLFADRNCGLPEVAILVNFASTSTTMFLRAGLSIQVNKARQRRNAANASNSQLRIASNSV